MKTKYLRLMTVIVTIAAILVIVLAGVQPAQAQNNFVNLTNFLKRVVYDSYNAFQTTNTVAGGALLVTRSNICATGVYTVWGQPTAMHPGRVFVTSYGGILHIQAETVYRPPVLEGYRSPLEKQYGYNVDGTLSDWDRGYFDRLDRWGKFRCLDLADLLRDNRQFGQNYARLLRAAGGAKAFSQECKALGLDTDCFPLEEGTRDDLNEANMLAGSVELVDTELTSFVVSHQATFKPARGELDAFNQATGYLNFCVDSSGYYTECGVKPLNIAVRIVALAIIIYGLYRVVRLVQRYRIYYLRELDYRDSIPVARPKHRRTGK